MANTYSSLSALLAAIASSIRGVKGTTAAIKGDDLPAVVAAINSDATAAAGDILSGKTAYIATGKVEGTIATKTSSNVTVSGATVSIPAGYYASAVSKSVASGSATTPATTVTANPSVSINSSGLITATASATESVTPTVSAGYVSTGTAGTITVSGSGTLQLTTLGATTWTPTTSNQIIAAGRYLTGAQTIAGDANLVAGNIKSGVTIFGVTGTFVYEGMTVATGNTSMAWNTFIARGTTNTTSFTAVQPTSAGSNSQEIHGFFKASGSTCTFAVSGATTEFDGTTSSSGGSVSVTVTSGKVYEFSLMAMSTTAVKLLIHEWV